MYHRIVHFIFICTLSVYLVVGLCIFRDYGVPIDEYSQIDLGRVNYERLAYGSLEIQTHFDRYYGPVFEVPLYVFSHFIFGPALGLDELSSRRLMMFLFFAVSVIVYYRFLSTIFAHPVYGLIGAMLLLSYPRIFAESFYNTKDVAFVSATIFVLWAVANIKTISWKNIAVLSFVTGFAMAMRAQGLLLLGVLTAGIVTSSNEALSKRVICSCMYVGLACVCTYLMFPVFWNDPFTHIVGFWQSSANPLGVPTYFFGQLLISPNTPWFYHFVWVTVSGALSVVTTFLLGVMWFGMMLLKKKQNIVDMNRPLFVMALIIVGTFVTSVFFHPRSYDGWRHIYYIYPCMIGFCVYTVKTFFDLRKTRIFLLSFLCILFFMALDSIGNVIFMVKNHPNEYVYFNALAGGYARAKANFDFDYWGISYKQLYEHLLTMPTKKTMYIYFDQVLPYTEAVMMPGLRKKGMQVVQTPNEADIYVSIQRDFKKLPSPAFRKIYSVNVEGVDISAIYQSYARTK